MKNGPLARVFSRALHPQISTLYVTRQSSKHSQTPSECLVFLFLLWLAFKQARFCGFTASSFILVINLAVNGFSNSYTIFAIPDFFLAAGGVAIHLVRFVLLFEWSCPENWMKTSMLAQVPFAISFLYVIALSRCLRTSSPPVPYLPPNPFSEPAGVSPRFVGWMFLPQKPLLQSRTTCQSASREYRS